VTGPAETAEPSPALVRELAMRAAELAAKVDAIHGELRAAPDPTRRAGVRLDDIAGTLRRVEGELGCE
jgi:outer membrane murein-binding lipoprotein Lpp